MFNVYCEAEIYATGQAYFEIIKERQCQLTQSRHFCDPIVHLNVDIRVYAIANKFRRRNEELNQFLR
jgi:hypothetical protein